MLVALAAVVGCVGGIYGIGGGSILAPVLIGSGRKPSEVAPAALAATFVTSVAGVITFTILSLHQNISVAPDWPTGIALGAGGLAGGYTGARIQSRMPDVLIRRLVGILVIAIGAYYWRRPPRLIISSVSSEIVSGGTSGTHSGLRATINAWLEDISFRTGMIAGFRAATAGQGFRLLGGPGR